MRSPPGGPMRQLHPLTPRARARVVRTVIRHRAGPVRTPQARHPAGSRPAEPLLNLVDAPRRVKITKRTPHTPARFSAPALGSRASRLPFHAGPHGPSGRTKNYRTNSPAHRPVLRRRRWANGAPCPPARCPICIHLSVIRTAPRPTRFRGARSTSSIRSALGRRASRPLTRRPEAGYASGVVRPRVAAACGRAHVDFAVRGQYTPPGRGVGGRLVRRRRPAAGAQRARRGGARVTTRGDAP